MCVMTLTGLRYRQRLQKPEVRAIINLVGRLPLADLSLRARGLTFTTLLSLVPFLAVTFSLLKAFGVQNQLEPTLLRLLEPLGPEGLDLSHRIVKFVNNLELGVLGAVGVATLFYTTISLIGEIENACNVIWRARQARSLARKFSDYLSVVLVGPILVFTGFALTASAQSHWLVQQVLQIRLVGPIVEQMPRVMPLLFLCAAFSFLYKFLPCTYVRLSSALVGGILAGVLWHLAGSVFTMFVVSSTQYTAIYSSFAILILFLLWLYVGWLITLVGVAVAYVYQNRLWVSPAFLTNTESDHDRDRLALSVLLDATRRHLAGRPPATPRELARPFGVAWVDMEEMIETLCHCGFLIRTVSPDGIVLARAPELIAVHDILAALRCESSDAAVSDQSDPVAWVLGQRTQAIEQALHEVTLRTLATQTTGGDNITDAASDSD